MTPRRVRLEVTDVGYGSVVAIDGVALRGVGGLTLESSAGQLTSLVLRFPVVQAEAVVSGGILVHSETYEALVKLGWTPPACEDSPTEVGAEDRSSVGAPGAGRAARGGSNSVAASSSPESGPWDVLRPGQVLPQVMQDELNARHYIGGGGDC